MIRNGEIRVKMESWDVLGATSFWIYRWRDEGSIEILEITGSRETTWKVFKDEGYESNIPPSFTIPHSISESVKRALSDVLDEHGFKPASEAGLRGKLEATERHLEDMRKLVFK